MSETTQEITAAEAMAKAGECREMAKRTRNSGHQYMLKHIAETWERIAKTLLTNGDQAAH